jgi:putative oxidoreductase
MQRAAHLLARAMEASFFLYEGVDKIVRFHEWRAVIADAQLPVPDAQMALILALLWSGSLMLLSGWRARTGAMLLLIFQLPTTALFEFDLNNPTSMVKSAAVIGGLLLLMAHQAPPPKAQ